MITPTEKKEFEEFCRRAESARLVPVSTSLIADLDTPLTLFFKINQNREHVFLFESMEGGEKWGRYSFIGFRPLVTFESKGESIEIISYDNGISRPRKFDSDPLAALRQLVGEMNAFDDPELPRFCGGAVGFLGYDMVRFMEELPDDHEALDFPDSSFMIPGTVLVHDSLEQKVTIVHWVDTSESMSLEQHYQLARESLDEVTELIGKPVPNDFFTKAGSGCSEGCTFTSNMEPEQYHDMVKQAREYILAGDIFQVVLSQRFHTTTTLPPHSIYRALRHINPSPYLFYLKLGDLIQIGSSPEILVRKEGEKVELRPIAGTRPRGRTVEEDLALEKELLADPKERAEHLMLVDLGRNDVGRIARGGSVEVRDLLVIERYSHVMHIVSGVHGVIDKDKDMFDVVEACFPAGTVSGAPKIRAMEIIEELEPGRRGPYAGSVGYFGFSGNMDFCITIRTFVIQGQDLWIQAGAGIVADSDPLREFEETVSKSMGLRRAAELAEKRF
ncbi:MAG: anthranilate synthase component I [Desulfofustis sp.]|nr:anthranilate synthase component I [Desulfofustis sp.]